MKRDPPMTHAPDCPASLGPMDCCCGTERPVTVRLYSIPTEAHGDTLVAETVERELPGFWAFLKARYPHFAHYGKPDGPPVGYVHGIEVHEAMAETIPAYVRALRQVH